MAERSNATMATSSYDRTSGSASATITSPYNSFLVRAQGGPIIQGQINKIRVSEVRFPYDVPTIVEAKNDKAAVYLYNVLINPEGDPVLNNSTTFTLTIPQGWYTVNEMAAAVNLAFANATYAPGPGGGPSAVPWWPAAAPGTVNTIFNCAPQESSQTLTILNDSVYNTTPGSQNYFFSLEPLDYFNSNVYGAPSLLWTLGFRSLYASLPLNPPAAIQLLFAPSGWNTGPAFIFPSVLPVAFAATCTYATGCPYTGAYTDFVDICSPALCQAQYIRDGSTSQNVLRRDLIARLYVADESSTREVVGSTSIAGPGVSATTNIFASPGSRPFIIHRQFRNTKNMKWTADRMIDAIDLTLFDMYGQPLPIPTIRYYGAGAPPFPDPSTYISLSGGARDYQITFLVDEHEDIHAIPNNVGYSYQ